MRLAWIVTAFVVGVCAVAGAFAQGYPAKPVRVIVPFLERGGVDVIARPVSQKLSELWGQVVTVENHPGEGGTVGAGMAAKSLPDGYTLLVNNSSHVMNAALITNLAYDPVKDFVPIAPLASTPFVLAVGKPAGVNTVAELIAAVKAKPGQFKFSGGYVGTRSHLGAEKFNLEADIKAVHVPAPLTLTRPGTAEVIVETIVGRITYMLLSLPLVMPQFREGRLIALAVTSAKRSSLLPEIPTVAEAGLAGFDYTQWYGMWAPAGTPADVVDKIGNDVARSLAAPDLRALLMKMGTEPMSMTPVEFERFVRSEAESVARIVKAAGIKPESQPVAVPTGDQRPAWQQRMDQARRGAAPGPGLRPITDPTQRVEVTGLSVLPPQGELWFRASVPPQQEDRPGIMLIRFVKELHEGPPTQPKEAHTMFAAVWAYDARDVRFESPAAFLQFVKRESERMVSPRHRLLASAVGLDTSLGSTCVRYNYTVEDHGVPQFPGSIFIMTANGIRCVHPHWPRYLIDAAYSQRYLQGQQPISVEREVEPFLKSPVFTATRPVAEAPTPAGWVSQMEAGTKAAEGQRWSDAEAAFKTALDEAERSFEAQDRRLAQTLWSLAVVYHKQGRRDEAEPLYRRALAIYEQHPGADQRRYGQTLTDLGVLYLQQGQHEQAEALLRRSLAVREVALRPEDLDVGQSLYNVMDLYNARHRWAEAEPFARRALAFYEGAKGPNDARVGRILHVLGHLLDAQGKMADAEPFLRRGVAIAEKVLGPDHPEVAHRLEGYAAVLRKLGRQSEAEELEARARAIRARLPRGPSGGRPPGTSWNEATASDSQWPAPPAAQDRADGVREHS